MKKQILFILSLLLGITSVFGQLQNGDFENGTPGGSAFKDGDVPFWAYSHGTPTLRSDDSQYAWMWSFAESGEGIMVDYNFIENECYEVSYRIRTRDFGNAVIRNSATVNIFAANGIIVNNSNLLAAYTNGQMINDEANDAFNDYVDNTWTDVSICFSPDRNYSKLWIYPYMSSLAQDSHQSEMSIDDIVIEPVVIDPLITADDIDISTTFTATMECSTDSILINVDAPNLTDLEYTATGPVSFNSQGLFWLPSGSTLTSFVVNITGKSACCQWNQDVTVYIEQDCEECELEAFASVGMCSDNDTPLDPSDDFYNITLDVFNTQGEPWMVLNSQGSIIYFGNGDENNVNLGDYLVSDQSEWFWVKLSNDPNCSIDVPVLAPQTCNFSCNISAITTVGDCNDNGTPDNPDDDFYFITVNVLGTNGLPWQLIGHPNNQTISYSGTGNETNIQLGPISVNDSYWNMHVFSTDMNYPNCRITTNVFAPKCSDTKPKDRISISPNPNNGIMNIKTEVDGIPEIELNIYRHDGFLVKTIKKRKTNTKVLTFGLELDVPSGLYVFKFSTQEGTITKKVIIKN